MKSVEGKGINKLKNFLANNRIVQVILVLAGIILLLFAYMSVSTLLSTIRSQNLLDAVATTLGEDYQQVEFKANLDNQVTNFKLSGDLYRQGKEGIGVEAGVTVNRVDQNPTEVALKLVSGSKGQYVHFGDLDQAVNAITDLAPDAASEIEEFGKKLNNSWLKLAEVDDTCYRNMVKALGGEDSELRKEVSKAYVKNPLIKVHYINTIKDGGREYYISTLFSNSKGFGRDLKDSKAINRVEGCKDGVSFIDSMATQSDESIKRLKQTEASVRTANVIVTVKDGRMTSIRNSNATGENVPVAVMTAEVQFKQDKKGRELPKVDESKLIELDYLKDDIEKFVAEAQKQVQAQMQQQPVMPGMGAQR